ncbi:MAG: SIR2 family protein [Candidatus Entotheonellia bacterium]
MLRTLCPEGDSFAELVRKNLYLTFPSDLHSASWRNWGNLVQFVQQSNPTLRTIAALCAIATGSEPPFKKNPRIHAIVNFNIDAVLRAYVHARYTYPLVRTVERPSKSPDPQKISVYYMHGFLRFDRRAGRLDKEAADKLVLSEHEYFDFFNNPTGLFNYAFLYWLREHSCLFIGLSMQDDNVRRLLHYSAKERFQAYREEGETRAEAKLKACRHFAILKQDDSADINQAIERSLTELGTRVLWVRSHDEIPMRLGQMYSVAGHDWDSVY